MQIGSSRACHLLVMSSRFYSRIRRLYSVLDHTLRGFTTELRHRPKNLDTPILLLLSEEVQNDHTRCDALSSATAYPLNEASLHQNELHHITNAHAHFCDRQFTNTHALAPASVNVSSLYRDGASHIRCEHPSASTCNDLLTTTTSN